MKRTIRSLLCIDSMHCGSIYAIWPDSFIIRETFWSTDEEGHKHEQVHEWKATLSPQQITLLQYWENLWEYADYYNVDTVLHLGEAIDGNDAKSRSVGIITSSTGEQVRAAEYLMKDHMADRTLHQWGGSAYHVVDGSTHADEFFARTMKQHCKRVDWHSALANMDFPPSDIVFNIAHDFSSAVIYPDVAMQKEFNFIAEQYAYGNYPVMPQIIIRGHRHLHFRLQWSQIDGWITPAWKMYHPIKHKTAYHAKWIPHVGGVIVLLKNDGSHEVIPKIYPTPHVFGNLRHG